MSFASLLTALTEYVGDVLVNDCGLPVPDRVLRYHGTLPDDCCSEAGTLSASWALGVATVDFPASAASQKADPCTQIPLYTVSMRYKTCWPVPEVNENGVELIDEQWDAKASMLADTADCVARSLIHLGCRQPGMVADPLTVAVQAQLARGWLRYIDVTPSVPLGGCAGLVWRMYASPLPGAVS